MNIEYKDIHNFECEELERLFLSSNCSSKYDYWYCSRNQG